MLRRWRDATDFTLCLDGMAGIAVEGAGVVAGAMAELVGNREKPAGTGDFSCERRRLRCKGLLS